MTHPIEPALPSNDDRASAAKRDIDAIRARIRDAEEARDAWRAAGREEKYLEAYVTVEALVLQMEARSRQSNLPADQADEVFRKKRTISADASGPDGSV